LDFGKKELSDFPNRNYDSQDLNFERRILPWISIGATRKNKHGFSPLTRARSLLFFSF
jgi:hypothetical protein